MEVTSKMNKLFIALLAIVLMVHDVAAFAISPGRSVINYEPGQQLQGSFSISSDRLVTLQFLVEGPLKPYLAIEVPEATLQQGEWREIRYAIQLPDVLPTDQLASMIVAREVLDENVEEGAFVNIRLAVGTKVDIRFDKPPKVAATPQAPLAEGILDIINQPFQEVTLGDLANLDLELENKGDIPLEAVRVEIIVYNMQGNELFRTPQNLYMIKARSKTKARISIDASRLSEGAYKARLIVSSGAGIVEREFTFTARQKASSDVVQQPRKATTTTAVILLAILLINGAILLMLHLRKRRELT